MATMASAFGLAVLAARKRRGWRQKDLAEAARLDRGYVSLIETGQVEPGLTVQERLAKAFGITLAELISDAEGERERYRARKPER